MARILIGNIKGPKGDTGAQGPQGPVGPQGPQGPLPPLVNNALATEAGVAALDAAMGKTLQEQVTNNKNDITELNSNLGGIVQRGIAHLTYLDANRASATINLDKAYTGQYGYAVAALALSGNFSTASLSYMPVDGASFILYCANRTGTYESGIDIPVAWIAIGSPS